MTGALWFQIYTCSAFDMVNSINAAIPLRIVEMASEKCYTVASVKLTTEFTFD